MSIKVPKSDADFGEQCRERGEYDPDTSTKTPLSRPRLYTPEQSYNYKSAWARYERALSLRPSKIETRDACTIYYFHSCDSNTGFWEVAVCPGLATYIDAGQSLVILCPPIDGYQLMQVDSDGETFVWQQLSGNRTVVVDPPTAKNPKIFIENICYSTGCDNGSSLPIILRVYPEGQPKLFDDLVIYNTPTDTNFGNSFAVSGEGQRDCQIVYTTPAPSFPQKVYCHNGEDIGITWSAPTCDIEFLTRYLIQSNTTGTYITVDEVLPNEERFFAVDVNTHYRIVSVFNIYGNIEQAISNTIYFSYSETDNQHLVFADDTSYGNSFSQIDDSYSKITLSVQVLNLDDSYESGLSFSSIDDSYSKITLSVQTLNVSDSYESGLSFSNINSAYTKVNLGGIVIG